MDDALDPLLPLALAYVPAAGRPAFALLLRLDTRLGEIALAPNAPIAAIKLAWWREALERLDSAPPPAEPLLGAIAGTLLPAGISGADLAALAGGWDALIDGEADPLARHARERGARLFALGSRLLGGGAEVAAAGEAWALASLTGEIAGAAHAEARLRFASLTRRRWPRRLRALGILAMRARAGLGEPGAGPTRRAIGRTYLLAVSGW